MSEIKRTVADYYRGKILQHGRTAQGVDWNSEDSQNCRFDQLSQLFENHPRRFSLLDYGCGWGSFLEYLERRGLSSKCDYSGCDLVDEMLQNARIHFGNKGNWLSKVAEGSRFDFVVASGIFNVRGSHSDEEALNYIHETLAQFDSLASEGFAFNALTTYSDADKMRDYLYYCDPGKLFDYCKRKYSRHVALLHDYRLYEFTVIVRKNTPR